MATATLTSKGQVTLPQEVRRQLALETGDKVDFVAVDGGFLLVPLRTDIRNLRGRFSGRVASPVPLEAMDAAIAEAAGAPDPR